MLKREKRMVKIHGVFPGRLKEMVFAPVYLLPEQSQRKKCLSRAWAGVLRHREGLNG
jgi:hypothetical protein